MPALIEIVRDDFVLQFGKVTLENLWRNTPDAATNRVAWKHVYKLATKDAILLVKKVTKPSKQLAMKC